MKSFCLIYGAQAIFSQQILEVLSGIAALSQQLEHFNCLLWVCFFFPKGEKAKQVLGSDPAGLPTLSAAPPGVGRANGLWDGSMPSRETFWGGTGGFTG